MRMRVFARVADEQIVGEVWTNGKHDGRRNNNVILPRQTAPLYAFTRRRDRLRAQCIPLACAVVNGPSYLRLIDLALMAFGLLPNIRDLAELGSGCWFISRTEAVEQTGAEETDHQAKNKERNASQTLTGRGRVKTPRSRASLDRARSLRSNRRRSFRAVRFMFRLWMNI